VVNATTAVTANTMAPVGGAARDNIALPTAPIDSASGPSAAATPPMVRISFFFSVPTNVVRAQNIQGLVKKVPLSQLFAETDSTFLSP
jgi:hypothetical protein